MPLLEIVQTRQITATIRLDESTAEQIDQYAAFLHASADDSWTRRWLTFSPRTATSKNSFGLRKLLTSHRAFVSAAHHRMARLQSRWCSLQRPRESWRPPVNCAPTVSVAVVKSPFGAAHRVYLDTPPLKGTRS
jgi:hypothetical protein